MFTTLSWGCGSQGRRDSLNRCRSRNSLGCTALRTREKAVFRQWFLKMDVWMDRKTVFLDIYAPTNHSSKNPKPVMVWIHGGGFVTGKAQQFDSSSLAIQGDVIMVVIQYRLGPFGFLSTSDDVIPGNYGLWDQLTVLRWIKDNILYFGGDPEKVTIFGESAGACSVNMHLMSAKPKGLFKRAVAQSLYYCIKKNPIPVTYELAKLVDCFPTNHMTVSKRNLHNNIKKCLQDIDAKVLYKASWPLRDNVKVGVLDFLYTPTIDGDFIPRDLYDLLVDRDYLQTTSFPDVDLMMSVNNVEGGAFYYIAMENDKKFNTSETQDFTMLKTFQSGLITPYVKNRYGVQSKELLNTLTFEYIFPLDFTTNVINKDYAVKFINDMFVRSASDLARSHSEVQGSGKTYLCLFNHDQKLARISFKGMIHGFDLVYTFGFTKLQVKAFTGSADTTISPSERGISNVLITFLTDFAKTGNPSASLSDKIPNGWPEFNDTSESYFALNTNMSVKDHMYPRMTSLWRNLVPRLVSSARNRSKPDTGGCQTSGGRSLTSYSRLCLFVLISSIITSI
ncbi:cholinesterase 2-like [Gigantopelta aegis]|uniref:cholinesterase 2-like n=1 Tax=Gigantopelta aegis TaxID=1735272 RepID=UPI001B88CC34|nr:cholinesterase 2-like [Gigantopelta aegis]